MTEALDRQATRAVTAARFPSVRGRRLRRTQALRDMVRETTLSPKDFIYPLFVVPGRDVRVPIDPMPGQAQLSIDHLLEEAAEAHGLGVADMARIATTVPSERASAMEIAEIQIVAQSPRPNSGRYWITMR